jgi:hypothetical protein
MIHYFHQWLDLYIVHIGGWISLGFAASLHKNGIPKSRQIRPLLLSAIKLSLILALFSSHAHNHWMNILGK